MGDVKPHESRRIASTVVNLWPVFFDFHSLPLLFEASLVVFKTIFIKAIYI